MMKFGQNLFMTETTNKDTHTDSETPPPKKSGSGCLKGCLVLIVTFAIILIGVAIAGWWFLNKTFGEIELSQP